MNLRPTQPAKMCGSRATRRGKSVEPGELAPQHLSFEVRRVASGRATRGLERFAEITQHSFDAVSFNDERSQLESAMVLRPLLGVAALATLNINFERAFEKLSPGAISRPMRGRMLRMRRVRDGFWWRC